MHRNKTAAAGPKTIVMTLVDREGDVVGVVVPDTKKETLEAVAKPIVDRSATIMTDGNPSYANLDDYFHGHHAVDHNKQFVRAMIHDHPHEFCRELPQPAEARPDRRVSPRQR
jgi:hypothetical protein